MAGAVKLSLGQRHGRGLGQPPLQVSPEPACLLLDTATSPPDPGGEAGLVGPSWDYSRSQPEQGLMTSACPWGNACGEECCSLRELCLTKASITLAVVTPITWGCLQGAWVHMACFMGLLLDCGTRRVEMSGSS